MNKEAGVVLLEVLLSVILISVGLVVLYQPFLSSLSALDYASCRLDADHWMINRMWEIQGQFARTRSLPGPIESEPVALGGRHGQHRMTLQPLTLDGQLLEATHQVWWHVGSKTKKVELTTYLFSQAESKP